MAPSNVSLSNDKRNELLHAYFTLYGSRLQLEYQPSETSLNISIRTHARKSAELGPPDALSEITNCAGGRDFHPEPVRMGKHLTTNIDGASKKRTSDSNANPESPLHAVRVLMRGYVLVSANDDGPPWCSLDDANRRLSSVEHLGRASAKNSHTARYKLTESEMTVRNERTRMSKADPRLNLTEIIELVTQRHTLWPVVSELKGHSVGNGIDRFPRKESPRNQCSFLYLLRGKTPVQTGVNVQSHTNGLLPKPKHETNLFEPE